jgi:dTMP kinase
VNGTFITVDGPGGVGKSTVAAALAAHLTAAGMLVRLTAEPSAGPVGVFTRSVADQFAGHALACLVAADRYDHLASEIRPALAGGAIVVCDRYLASSLVLQRIDQVPADFILAVNAGIQLPDLAVILTAAPEVVRDRLQARGARHRFERDPANPAREVSLYREAAAILTGMGVLVQVIDTGAMTQHAIVCRIADAVASRTGNVTGHG